MVITPVILPLLTEKSHSAFTYLAGPHTLRLVLPTTGWVAAGRQWPALLMPRRVTRAVNEAFTANGRPRRTAPTSIHVDSMLEALRKPWHLPR